MAASHLTQDLGISNAGENMPRSTGTQTRTFAYNSTTQFLASATNPENGMISYTYNADSTLSTKTYNNGNYQK